MKPFEAEQRLVEVIRLRHLAMGHAHSDTTLGYCHASALSVPSPLEAFA